MGKSKLPRESGGDRIRRWRLSTEPPMSQADLARRLRVDRSAVSTWETGKRVPSLQCGWHICRVFGKRLEQLVEGTFWELPERMARRPRR